MTACLYLNVTKHREPNLFFFFLLKSESQKAPFVSKHPNLFFYYSLNHYDTYHLLCNVKEVLRVAAVWSDNSVMLPFELS